MCVYIYIRLGVGGEEINAFPDAVLIFRISEYVLSNDIITKAVNNLSSRHMRQEFSLERKRKKERKKKGKKESMNDS